MLNKLRSCYNRCIKIYSSVIVDSLTNILFNFGLPSFDTLLRNAAVTFLYKSYSLIFTLLYSFPSVCLSVFFMFVCAFMSLLLSVVYGPCCLN